MKLQLSKQYPFNFVAFAFESLGKPIDDRALSKFDAYEVDRFLQSRNSIEKAALEYSLGSSKAKCMNIADEVRANYKKALSIVVADFDYEHRNGRFGLVALLDFNTLALAWPKAVNLAGRLDRLKNLVDFKLRDYVIDIRDDVATFASHAKEYGMINPKTKSSIIEQFSVLELDMDSRGRQLLDTNNIHTVGDLTRVTAEYLLSIRDFGEAQLEAVRKCLKDFNAHLLGE